MTAATTGVVAIGNAIVDIIGRCDDAFLAQHGAPKGHMRLVDAETMSTLYGAMGPSIEISGGSAANTMAGIASFGGAAGFIGKVADDEFGRIFKHDIAAAGVEIAAPAALYVAAAFVPMRRMIVRIQHCYAPRHDDVVANVD